MFIHQPDPLAPRGGQETPERAFLSRRSWLRIAAYGGAALAGGVGYALWRREANGQDGDVIAAGRWPPEAEQKYAGYYPARHDERFTYGRAETLAAEAAR